VSAIIYSTKETHSDADGCSTSGNRRRARYYRIPWQRAAEPEGDGGRTLSQDLFVEIGYWATGSITSYGGVESSPHHAPTAASD
jgi:hypothetical protein